MADKSLMFFLIALVCFWLVLDEFYGRKLISQFILKLLPSAKEGEQE